MVAELQHGICNFCTDLKLRDLEVNFGVTSDTFVDTLF